MIVAEIRNVLLRHVRPDRRTQSMPPVKLSARYQVAIPPEIRKSLGLTPVKPVASLRGAAKGIDTRVPRDGHRV